MHAPRDVVCAPRDPESCPLAQVDGVSGRIGLPERYLGVHIRHGDSCIAPPTHDESDDRKESQGILLSAISCTAANVQSLLRILESCRRCSSPIVLQSQACRFGRILLQSLGLLFESGRLYRAFPAPTKPQPHAHARSVRCSSGAAAPHTHATPSQDSFCMSLSLIKAAPAPFSLRHRRGRLTLDVDCARVHCSARGALLPRHPRLCRRALGPRSSSQRLRCIHRLRQPPGPGNPTPSGTRELNLALSNGTS
eukprot:2776384-Rhodomonas_salina.2